MTQTQKLLRDMNDFIQQVGDSPIEAPLPSDQLSELEYLRQVKQEYTRRLLEKSPKYNGLPKHEIPDLFLDALRKREAELTSK